MNIPVFKPYLDNSELEACTESLRLGWLGPGSYVKEFENKIADLMNVEYTSIVAVNTGTSAVHIGLTLCDVGYGDEVITPSFNNIADFQSIVALGAKPVFCDIKDNDLTIDPSKIEELITDKTKAIICLDYGTALCDYQAVQEIASKYDIKVLYDAAHSFGSKDAKGTMIGKNADITTFSFDPVKNITCIDGGAIFFKDKHLAEKARNMRLLGQKQNQEKLYSNNRSWTYDVDNIGFRYHLANLHAAIGLKQLEKLKEIHSNRQRVFNLYSKELSEIPEIIVPKSICSNIIPFIFVLRILNGNRKKFREYLLSHSIDTGIHWQPGHKFLFFSQYKQGDLTITDKISEQIVTLPTYPGLKNEEILYITKTIKDFFRA